MYQKKKGLGEMSENHAEIYVIETKVVICHSTGRVAKKKGGENEIEAGMLLKTHIEKMSPFRLAKIFMKTNGLRRSYQNVDEKKGSYKISEKR